MSAEISAGAASSQETESPTFAWQMWGIVFRGSVAGYDRGLAPAIWPKRYEMLIPTESSDCTMERL